MCFEKRATSIMRVFWKPELSSFSRFFEAWRGLREPYAQPEITSHLVLPRKACGVMYHLSIHIFAIQWGASESDHTINPRSFELNDLYGPKPIPIRRVLFSLSRKEVFGILSKSISRNAVTLVREQAY